MLLLYVEVKVPPADQSQVIARPGPASDSGKIEAKTPQKIPQRSIFLLPNISEGLYLKHSSKDTEENDWIWQMPDSNASLQESDAAKHVKGEESEKAEEVYGVSNDEMEQLRFQKRMSIENINEGMDYDINDFEEDDIFDKMLRQRGKGYWYFQLFGA